MLSEANGFSPRWKLNKNNSISPFDAKNSLEGEITIKNTGPWCPLSILICVPFFTSYDPIKAFVEPKGIAVFDVPWLSEFFQLSNPPIPSPPLKYFISKIELRSMLFALLEAELSSGWVWTAYFIVTSHSNIKLSYKLINLPSVYPKTTSLYVGERLQIWLLSNAQKIPNLL